MTENDQKANLRRYLKLAHDALLWKLDGLSEYDIRRPMLPTGTNLLGLIKHVAAVELGYFGTVFGRPSGEPSPWDDDEDPNGDMYATAEETREDIVGLYGRAWAQADATIDALELSAPGRVPWWGEHGEVTLHLILVHVTTEVARHAGHADAVRELIDGSVGLRDGNSNVPPADPAYWAEHRDRLEAIAKQAG